LEPQRETNGSIMAGMFLISIVKAVFFLIALIIVCRTATIIATLFAS
jgi:hypothetical protein